MDDMEVLLQILEEVTDVEYIDADDQKLFPSCDRLFGIYQNDDFRHEYHRISAFMEKLESDRRDQLEDNIRRIDNIMSSNDQYNAASKKVKKLSDHVCLEVLRLARMDSIRFIGDKAAKELKEAKEIINSEKGTVDRVRDEIKGIHTHIITILGIFAGLVFGFSSSVKFLEQTFVNINNLNFDKMIFYIIIIGCVIFNTLFFLLYAVAKISNTSIAVTCRNRHCSQCIECKHNLIKKALKKYPYFVAYNIISILMGILFYTRIQ